MRIFSLKLDVQVAAGSVLIAVGGLRGYQLQLAPQCPFDMRNSAERVLLALLKGSLARRDAGRRAGIANSAEPHSVCKNQQLCNTIRPRKRLSFFVSELTCEMRRHGFGSAKPGSAIDEPGQLNPPGQPRSERVIRACSFAPKATLELD
jgi:hypothetical protein